MNYKLFFLPERKIKQKVEKLEQEKLIILEQIHCSDRIKKMNQIDKKIERYNAFIKNIRLFPIYKKGLRYIAIFIWFFLIALPLLLISS